MRKILFTFLVMSIPAVCFSEVTRKVIHSYAIGSAPVTGHPVAKEAAYFKQRKEISREKYDEKGKIIEKTGSIPDGFVKEYFEDGELKEVWRVCNASDIEKIRMAQGWTKEEIDENEDVNINIRDNTPEHFQAFKNEERR